MHVECWRNGPQARSPLPWRHVRPGTRRGGNCERGGTDCRDDRDQLADRGTGSRPASNARRAAVVVDSSARRVQHAATMAAALPLYSSIAEGCLTERAGAAQRVLERFVANIQGKRAFRLGKHLPHLFLDFVKIADLI